MADADYEKLGAEIGRTVAQKNEAYGSSFGKSGEIMRILYPGGIALEQMDDALAVVRVLDKLFRIATDRDALGESPFLDIAGYGLLGAARVRADRTAVLDPYRCEKCGNSGLKLNAENWCRECFAGETEKLKNVHGVDYVLCKCGLEVADYCVAPGGSHYKHAERADLSAA